jgi:hypothetical protein
VADKPLHLLCVCVILGVTQSCIALHNFIRVPAAGVDAEWELEGIRQQFNAVCSSQRNLELNEENTGTARRNSMAEKMWEEYVVTLVVRGITDYVNLIQSCVCSRLSDSSMLCL